MCGTKIVTDSRIMGAEVSYQIVHLHDLGTAKTVCPCQKHFWYGLRAPVGNVWLDEVCGGDETARTSRAVWSRPVNETKTNGRTK